MKCKLVKLPEFSGSEASIYTILVVDEEDGEPSETLFDSFIKENKNIFLSELKDIFLRLKTIGNDTGARSSYFKLKEGKPGDGVCALYDSPNKRLRLYCIRYGTELVIVGGGGSKNVRALQDDQKLKKENYFLRWVSEKITECLKDGEISFSYDNMDFEGFLTIEDYYEK